MDKVSSVANRKTGSCAIYGKKFSVRPFCSWECSLQAVCAVHLNQACLVLFVSGDWMNWRRFFSETANCCGEVYGMWWGNYFGLVMSGRTYAPCPDEVNMSHNQSTKVQNISWSCILFIPSISTIFEGNKASYHVVFKSGLQQNSGADVWDASPSSGQKVIISVILSQSFHNLQNYCLVCYDCEEMTMHKEPEQETFAFNLSPQPYSGGSFLFGAKLDFFFSFVTFTHSSN